MQYQNINGTDPEYKICSNGTVISVKYKKSRILKDYKAGKGYRMVDMMYNGKRVKKYVHRLVAEHFIKNSKNLPEVNHKDGDKNNNCVKNLNWTDGVGNMKHAREKLGFDNKGEKSKLSKLTEKSVREIFELYSTGKYTTGQIGKKYGVDYRHVWGILKGIYWKHLKIA